MEEQSLDLRRYVEVVLNWWWLIVLGPVVAGVIGLAFSLQQTPVYEAGATVLVEQMGNPLLPTLGDIQTSQRLAATYRRLITIRPTLQEVVDELQASHTVEGLSRQVSASVFPDTSLLQIQAKSSDPAQAVLIANTLAQVFIDRTRDSRLAEIARLQAAARAQGLADSQNLVEAQLNALGSLTLVEPAEVPAAPISPRTFLNTTVAVLLGGLLALGAAFVLEYFNNTVRSGERLERMLGLVSLGTVFRWNLKKYPGNTVMAKDHPRSLYTETFRQVRANLQFALATRPAKVAVVTSAGAQEGKSTIVANIGAVLAVSGVRVVLVDADQRRPSLHNFFGLPNGAGLSTFLADPTVSLEQVLQPTSVDGLQVLTAGPVPPNPTELLGSPRMRTLVEEIRAHGDVILYDSPPALAVADAVVLASQVGGVLLVADVHRTRMDAMKLAMDVFRRDDLRPLGVILNKYKPQRIGYGYGYHYGYYRYYSHSGDGHETETGSRRRSHRRGWLGRLRRSLARRRS